MFRITLAVLFLTIQALSSAYIIKPKAGGCNIALSKLSPEPIVTTTNNEFIYPNPGQNDISLDVDETIRISCPGGKLTVGGVSTSNFLDATCVSGTQFASEADTINFNSIKCSREAFHTARYSGNECEQKGKEIEIGYVLSDNTFARQIRICFDTTVYNPLYSTYNLTKSIGNHESGVERPSFIEDDFYKELSKKVNNMYVRGGQRAQINGLLGLAAGSTIYIQNNDYFLSRGHLTAKADFVYGPQQSATFHYVNAAPQWQTFNGQNWNTAEGDVRDYAEANELDLVVYTGTYGVTTLPHAQTKKDIPLYLYTDSKGNNALPVPELYWKVVYDPASKKGVALLGLNNPYQHNVEKSIICDDISDKLNWLNWVKESIEFGYSYACSVDDLRNKVSYLPKFEVNGLLL